LQNLRHRLDHAQMRAFMSDQHLKQIADHACLQEVVGIRYGLRQLAAECAADSLHLIFQTLQDLVHVRRRTDPIGGGRPSREKRFIFLRNS